MMFLRSTLVELLTRPWTELTTSSIMARLIFRVGRVNLGRAKMEWKGNVEYSNERKLSSREAEEIRARTTSLSLMK